MSEVEFGEVRVVDQRDATLALNLNQWNTAIPVVILINKNVVGLGKEMHEGFGRMDKNFERMNETLETLPERIARAFKDMK